jgi:predicted Zn-dependent peptidase
MKTKQTKTKQTKTKHPKTKQTKTKQTKTKQPKTKQTKTKQTKQKKYIYEVSKLNNGLTYFINDNKKYNDITIIFMVKCGGITEGKYNGLSHLLEHMLFRGTKNNPSKTLLIKKMEEYGGYINGATSYESTYYYISVHPSKLLHIIPLLSELIRFSNLDEYLLENEKNILQNEFNMRSDMNSYLDELVELNIYNNSIYKDDFGGTLKSMKEIEKHHILAYINTFYNPDNCMIGILGNLKTPLKKILFEVNKYFGMKDFLNHYKLEKEHKKYRNYIKEYNYFNKMKEQIELKRRIPIKYNWNSYNILNKKLNQSYIYIIFDGLPLINNKEIDKLEIQNNFIKYYLNNYKGGRLINILRNEENLIYNLSVSSKNFTLSYNGLFTIKYNIIPNNKNIRYSIKLILEELNRLKTEFIQEKEIKELNKMIKYRSEIRNYNSQNDVTKKIKEYILGDLNSQYYKKQIQDYKKEDSKREKQIKEEEKEQLLIPHNIQNRIKQLFDFNKMKIVCFSPIKINLKTTDFKF